MPYGYHFCVFFIKFLQNVVRKCRTFYETYKQIMPIQIVIYLCIFFHFLTLVWHFLTLVWITVLIMLVQLNNTCIYPTKCKYFSMYNRGYIYIKNVDQKSQYVYSSSTLLITKNFKLVPKITKFLRYPTSSKTKQIPDKT